MRDSKESEEEKDAAKEIIVVGGSLSGLSTAYYLTKLSPMNKVTLLERERKCGQGSSSHNGGLFQTNDFEPWTEKSLLFDIMPGLLSMTKPQCAWLSKFFGQPGAIKFLYYFSLQNFIIGSSSKESRVGGLKHLMELSEAELLAIVEELKIKPADIKLRTDAKLFELR